MYTSHIHSNRPFYFSMKLSGAKSLGPGGDVSASEGKGDLGAAQVEFPGCLDQHWKQMRKRALGTKWTGSSPCSTNYMWFLDL